MRIHLRYACCRMSFIFNLKRWQSQITVGQRRPTLVSSVEIILHVENGDCFQRLGPLNAPCMRGSVYQTAGVSKLKCDIDTLSDLQAVCTALLNYSQDALDSYAGGRLQMFSFHC